MVWCFKIRCGDIVHKSWEYAIDYPTVCDMVKGLVGEFTRMYYGEGKPLYALTSESFTKAMGVWASSHFPVIELGKDPKGLFFPQHGQSICVQLEVTKDIKVHRHESEMRIPCHPSPIPPLRFEQSGPWIECGPLTEEEWTKQIDGLRLNGGLAACLAQPFKEIVQLNSEYGLAVVDQHCNPKKGKAHPQQLPTMYAAESTAASRRR
eukprot:GHVO01040524.1.p1 GENE.GHVO01040524.1~~GHVO01040524.1.p1  ORF type:complete len:207 (+),score=28.37 GHVO01040524.1:277-897(+)